MRDATILTCGRCRSRGVQPLTRWQQLFVCDGCLEELDHPMDPVTRSVAMERALFDRLLPIAAARGCAVNALATKLLTILASEPVLIDNLLDEEA